MLSHISSPKYFSHIISQELSVTVQYIDRHIGYINASFFKNFFYDELFQDALYCSPLKADQKSVQKWNLPKFTLEVEPFLCFFFFFFLNQGGDV